MTTLSAIIELVGVRELAKSEPKAVLNRLTRFKDCVVEAATKLKKDDNIFFFSDRAFVEADSNSIFDFFSRLRFALFDAGIYFKAAVAGGKLDHVKVYQSNENIDFPQLDGSYFGQAAAALFSYLENLKGIGIYLDRKTIQRSLLKEKAVESCYLPQANSTVAVYFLDLKYESAHCSEGILDRLAEAIDELRSKNSRDPVAAKKLIRYYITTLVTIANSTSPSILCFDDLLDLEQLHNKCPFLAQFYSGEIRKLLRGIKGYEQIHYSIFSRFIKEYDSTETNFRSAFLSKMFAQTSMDDLAKNVPEELYPKKHRQRYLKLKKENRQMKRRDSTKDGTQ